MPDCPHGDGAHWPGDSGDVVDSLDHLPRLDEDSTTYWLRTLGAIQ